MTMIQTHFAALQSGKAAFHEFLLYYKKTGQIVYGFVEGKDDPSFYKGLIESNIPNGWAIQLINAGTKRQVLQICEEMDWSRFPRKRVCFFVDRDLSNFINEGFKNSENIYITDKYSIENEVANCSTLERVIEEVLNITGISPSEFEKIHQLYNDNFEVFCDAMAPIMAQIILWKRESRRPCLDNINMKELFYFSDGKLSLKNEFVQSATRIEFAGKCCCCECSSSDLLSESEHNFRQNNGSKIFIRGKYVLWFFVQFCLNIYESIDKFCTKYSKKPKVRVSIGQTNALVVIGPRVRIPDSLKDFIRHNYVDYIRSMMCTT